MTDRGQEEPAREQAAQEQEKKNSQNNPGEAGRVKITFYTDPLCCWSWGFEPHWRKLLRNYGDLISFDYVLCGLIPNWNSYNDPINSVSRPAQMGPVWMHASQVTHAPMKYNIWHEHPPTSSYPACIAVKTAALQAGAVEDEYLLQLRKAVMEEGFDISDPQVLLSIAEGVVALDVEKFKRDWQSGAGKDLFRKDLQQAKFHNIGRFPTLTFQRTGMRGIMIVGYRPYEVLEQAFLQMQPPALQNGNFVTLSGN